MMTHCNFRNLWLNWSNLEQVKMQQHGTISNVQFKTKIKNLKNLTNNFSLFHAASWNIFKFKLKTKNFLPKKTFSDFCSRNKIITFMDNSQLSLIIQPLKEYLLLTQKTNVLKKKQTFMDIDAIFLLPLQKEFYIFHKHIDTVCFFFFGKISKLFASILTLFVFFFFTRFFLMKSFLNCSQPQKELF